MRTVDSCRSRASSSAGSLVSGFDVLGRVVSYSEGSGGASVSTAYDASGRVGSRTWRSSGSVLLASVSYGYDGGGERRGLVTSVSDSDFALSQSSPVVRSFSASYGPGGELVSQTVPGGLVQSFAVDASGDATSTTWSRGSAVFLSDSQTSDVHGRWREQSLGGAHPGWTAREYGYDQAGRLLSVGETTGPNGGDLGVGCVTRVYGFDVNSNRETAVSYPDAGDGCSTGTAASWSQSLSYDAADRLLAAGSAAGLVQDWWGRATTLPAGLTGTPSAGAATIGYYANDLARSVAHGGTTRTWSLDPAGRLATAAAAVTATGAAAGGTVNHYSGAGGDSPAWTADTAAGGAATIRRYLAGPAGYAGEAATTGGTTMVTIGLSGLHGDVLRTTSPDAAGSPDGPGVDADEYGIIRSATDRSTTTGPRYGWLGAKQRPADTGTAGLILMGVRLYTPALGRFLSTDPVYGGNANTYVYPQDPVNMYDLDGRMADGPEWLNFLKSKIFKQRKIVGHLVLRGGRPAIHWQTPESREPNRIEWDKRNGWHYNKAGESGHFTVRQGFRDYGAHLWRNSRVLSRGGLIGIYYAAAAQSQRGCGIKTHRGYPMSTCTSWM